MKSKIVMISVLFVMLAGFVAAFFIFPLGKGETDMEKINRLLDHTGQAIYEQNKLLVDSYNKSVDEGLEEEGTLSAINRSEHDNISISGNLSVPAQSTENIEISVPDRLDFFYDLNGFYTYYAISDYFNDYLSGSNEFLNKVFYINSAHADAMYVKIKLSDTGLDLYVMQYEDITDASAWRRNIKISIIYDWDKDNPISVEQWSIDLEDGVENDYQYSKIDFEKKTYNHTELSFIDNAIYEDIILKNEDYLKKNIDDIIIYSMNYSDASTLKGYSFDNVKESDFNGVLTDEQSQYIIDAYKNMKFVRLSEFLSEIVPTTAIVYENSDIAVDYVAKKYIISYDNETSRLQVKKNKGLEETIEDALLLLDDYYCDRKQFTVDSTFDTLNYVYDYRSEDAKFEKYDGNNFRKYITNDDIREAIPQDVYDLIKDWYENKYDEDKFYFQTEKLGDYNFYVNNEDCCLFLSKENGSVKEEYTFYCDSMSFKILQSASNKTYLGHYRFTNSDAILKTFELSIGHEELNGDNFESNCVNYYLLYYYVDSDELAYKYNNSNDGIEYRSGFWGAFYSNLHNSLIPSHYEFDL